MRQISTTGKCIGQIDVGPWSDHCAGIQVPGNQLYGHAVCVLTSLASLDTSRLCTILRVERERIASSTRRATQQCQGYGLDVPGVFVTSN